jgi:hypothetical protein
VAQIAKRTFHGAVCRKAHPRIYSDPIKTKKACQGNPWQTFFAFNALFNIL